METFPSIDPVFSLQDSTTPATTAISLGDGYKKNVRYGLNLIKPEWRIEWMVSEADASTIDLFLKQRSSDSEWFYWTPPDSTVQLRFRCDQWTLGSEAESLVKVSATFRQVFELEAIALVSVAAPSSSCGSDLCDQNFLAPSTDGTIGGGGYPGLPLTVNTVCDSIQWLRDGVPISGATNASYTPGFDDLGTTLTPRVICNGFALPDTFIPIQSVNPTFNNGGVIATVTLQSRSGGTNYGCTIPGIAGGGCGGDDTRIRIRQIIYPFTGLKAGAAGNSGNGWSIGPSYVKYQWECYHPPTPLPYTGYGWQYTRADNGQLYLEINAVCNLPSPSNPDAYYNTFLGQIIVNVTLDSPNPAYGNTGDNVLAKGIQEALDNGAVPGGPEIFN